MWNHDTYKSSFNTGKCQWNSINQKQRIIIFDSKVRCLKNTKTAINGEKRECIKVEVFYSDVWNGFCTYLIAFSGNFQLGMTTII